ncbi:hypothetical protein BG004_004425 [Podila humilis]|nr:hypothetical protein BG004_004425 [Podila humilis]
MKNSVSLSVLIFSTAAAAILLAPSPTLADTAFSESLEDHTNFIIAHGWGPERWGCSFTRTQVHETEDGTKITIGKDSELKPYSCGELIYRKDHLGYGHYTIDMIASNVVGQVTSFFLFANGHTEIDIELTGLNNSVGWMNVWHNNQQNPVAIDLPFDSSKDWHTYSFEWRKEFIAWSIDGKLVLNRSDIATSSPEEANYKLVINSWTQVQKEINIDWAGKFEYPDNGVIPQAQFRSIRYDPKIYGSGQEEQQQQKPDEAQEDPSKKEQEEVRRGEQLGNGTPQQSGATDTNALKNSVSSFVKGGSALLAVALAVNLLV